MNAIYRFTNPAAPSAPRSADLAGAFTAAKNAATSELSVMNQDRQATASLSQRKREASLSADIQRKELDFERQNADAARELTNKTFDVNRRKVEADIGLINAEAQKLEMSFAKSAAFNSGDKNQLMTGLEKIFSQSKSSKVESSVPSVSNTQNRLVKSVVGDDSAIPLRKQSK